MWQLPCLAPEVPAIERQAQEQHFGGKLPQHLFSGFPLTIVLGNMSPLGAEIREAMEREGRGSQQIPP